MCSACRSHAVTVEIRRMGGGFGGKETQGNQFAALAALAAKKLNRAVKIRPDRDDDMIATGKRHDFLVDYDVGFDDDGRIHGVDCELRGALRLFGRPLRPGHRPRAVPLPTTPISIRQCRLTSAPLNTNTVSNTAFRGFGGPQGMVGGERMIEEIAYALGKDPLEIRKLNFYGTERPQRHALSPDGRGQHHPPHRRGAGGELRLSGAARGDHRAFNDNSRVIKQGHRADAGEVRHLLHRDRTTTRPARWCMSITTARST